MRNKDGILQMANAYRECAVLLAAVELEVFDALGDEWLTADRVAERTGTDARAMDRLLRALAVLELVEASTRGFANTREGRTYLCTDSPEYIGSLRHTAHTFHSWATLTHAVRKGGAVQVDSTGERDARWTEDFIASMHYRAKEFAPELVAKLDMSGVRRVLDAGGGSGAFAMAFARAKEDIEAVVFDLPRVVELARGYIASEGLSDRVQVRAGDLLVNDFGSGFDLVFFSAIVHMFSAEQNRELVRKAADALEPGGRIIIEDFVMDDSRLFPSRGALFALNMLVNTRAGDTFTESEVRSWFEEAGATQIGRIETGPATAMMVAKM